METKPNSVAQTFLDLFEDHVENSPELSNEDKEKIGSTLKTQPELEESLPTIKEKLDAYGDKIALSDKNIKQWQESKKFWTQRQNQLLSVLGLMMEKLHIPGKSLKAGGVKLSTTTKTSLEVDEEWIIKQYQALADALQNKLPTYVTVKLSVDKTKLNTYLKMDNSLLINNPERVHTKESRSISVKAAK